MNDCERDPVVSNLVERIANLTRVPSENFESFQVLRYRKGEKYDLHHDSAETDYGMPAGPRILTFFMYLSDVEEGGETHFPHVGPEGGIKAKPRKGSAILWPSVDVDQPGRIDPRFMHAALPVKKGIKRAANTWIHLKGYTCANVFGCTGSYADAA